MLLLQNSISRNTTGHHDLVSPEWGLKPAACDLGRMARRPAQSSCVSRASCVPRVGSPSASNMGNNNIKPGWLLDTMLGPCIHSVPTHARHHGRLTMGVEGGRGDTRCSLKLLVPSGKAVTETALTGHISNPREKGDTPRLGGRALAVGREDSKGIAHG